MREREKSFYLSNAPCDVPDYNSLYDQDLRHYFDNRRTQKFLYKSGLIDREGRVIDQEKNKSKLFIIEQEFKHAEKEEFWRLKEEAEFRRRIQIKRHEALEQARRTQRISDLKAERSARQIKISEAKYGPKGAPAYGGVNKANKPGSSTEEMEAYLESVFQQADVNGDGFLDHTEFKALLRNADLGLSNPEIRRVLAEADENEDGMIDYHEFVPVAVQVLQGYHARKHAMEHRDEDEKNARELAMDYLLHGMTREELEATMFNLFQKADLDGDGFLNRDEFRSCINDASLGLTRREINLLMAEADEDSDGKISYEEFVPLCFDLLLKNLQDDIFLLQRNRGELENYLLEIFQYADAEATGFLSHADVSNLLDMANLGLSQLQIATIVSAASKDGRGTIGYHKFISVAAEMIAEMFHANMLSDRRRGAEVPQDVNDLSAEDLEAFLLKLFQGADPDNTGALTPADFKRVLLSTDLGFTPEQMRRILVQADETADGVINYQKFTTTAVETIESLKAKGTLADQERLREREAEELSKEFHVHDCSREQIEELFANAFTALDKEQKKRISRSEFRTVVHGLDLELDKREVNALMISADEGPDGLIAYEEFVPLAYDVLRQSILDMLIDKTPHPAQVEEYLLQILGPEDPRETGRLPAEDVELIVSGSDFNLSTEQIRRLMDACGAPDPDGSINYRVFAQNASKMIHEMFSETYDEPQFDWSQIPPEEVEDFLLQLFKEADKSDKGMLPFRDTRTQLLSIDMGGGQGLTDHEIQCVLATAVEDDYGLVDVTAFSKVATVALRTLRANTLLEVSDDHFDGPILGRSRAELLEGLAEGFVANDTDKDGKLTRRQMRDALEGLNLAPEHIAVCMGGVEEDDKGKITIADGWAEKLVRSLARIELRLQLDAERSKPPPLSKRLLDAFTAADADGKGLLRTNVVKDVLREMGLGLKERHVITILSAAEKRDDMINYGAFSKYAAEVIEDIAGKEADVQVEPSFNPVVNEYREACREVAAMEKSDLYHLRSLTAKTAPQGIVLLLTLIGDLLGEENNGDWNKQRDLIARSDFLGAVAQVDVRLLTDPTLEKIKAVISNPDCQPDQVSRPSTSQYLGAVTLAKWLIKLYAEALKIKSES